MLKTTSTTASDGMTFDQAKFIAVVAVYAEIAPHVLDQNMTREMAVRVLKPIQDTLHKGPRIQGHAEQLEATVQDNLDSFLDQIKGDVE